MSVKFDVISFLNLVFRIYFLKRLSFLNEVKIKHFLCWQNERKPVPQLS